MDGINSKPMPKRWEQRVADPPSIERQMLLAQFACAALTGLLADPNVHGRFKDSADAAFQYADAMLAEFDKRVPR